MSVNGLRRYPAYRDSGADWLGKVPAHWEVRRIKLLLRERHARSVSGKEQLLRVSQYTGITKRRRKDTRAESLIGYRRVAPSDLVVNIMLAWNGSLGVSPFGGVVSPAYCVYRFGANTHPRYAHYLLRSPLYRTRIKTVSTGVVESRLRLYTDDLYRLEALLPPRPEQRAIVRFLEAADRRIRRYIRAKERLVELLEERKRALIHEAVTGRIDVRTGQPYSAYKDSGVEWLGKVPEHWEVRSLGTLGWFFKGNGGTKADETEEGVPCVRYGDLYTRHQFHITESKACVAPHRAGEYTPIRYGDVLFAGSGETLDEIGKSAVNLIKGSAVCGGDVIVFRPTIDIDAEFFGWSTDSRQAASQKARIGRGITVMHIYSSNLKYLAVPLPPLSEQAPIARYLDLASQRMQGTISATQRQIDLLREYRTRLIADVVTGKLDVRGAAARLPATDPRAGDRNRADAIRTESNLHSTAHDMMKEASA